MKKDIISILKLTQVLVNLIEDAQKDKGLSLESAVKISLNRIIGAYGIVIFDSKNPTQIIAAKLGSPLVIGIGEKDFSPAQMLLHL